MRKHLGLITLAALVVAAFVAYTVAYPVKTTDLAFVTRYGTEVIEGKVYDGRLPGQAGLKFKWLYPVNMVTRYDARVRLFEDPSSQLTTKDERHILLTMFCAWRIADPVKFNSDIRTVSEAESTIRSALMDKKGNVVGSHNFSEFVNTDPAEMKLAEMEEKILDALRSEVEEQYGVEIVMVGIKSLGLPESITETVIAAMKERQTTTSGNLRSEGTSDADTIRGRADTASKRILAFAKRKAAEIRAEGYREAAELYPQFNDDPGFAMFLRSLESLRTELSANTVFLLDGSRIPAVKFLTDGPSVPDGDQD